MTVKTTRVRWECPSGKHPGVLGPRQPRLDSIVRYCLACSQETGRLVARVAPALERQRQTAAERQKAKAKAKRLRVAAQREATLERQTERFTVAGVDLRDEMRRYVRLQAFGGPRGKLASRLPGFDVTRHDWSPNRCGFASPWEWRIHLSLWPNMPLGQARRTLIHELTHLYVGKINGEWHGVRFTMVLNRALKEAGL